MHISFFLFQAEDGIRDLTVTGVQTCALPISPQMAPVDVVLVRRVNHRVRIARYRHIFDLEFPGSEQHGRAAGSGYGVEMVPAVLLGSEKDAVSDEVQGFIFSEIRERSVLLFAAVPDCVSFAARGIGNVNSPRIGANLKKRKTLLEAVDADEDNLLDRKSVV